MVYSTTPRTVMCGVEAHPGVPPARLLFEAKVLQRGDLPVYAHPVIHVVCMRMHCTNVHTCHDTLIHKHCCTACFYTQTLLHCMLLYTNTAALHASIHKHCCTACFYTQTLLHCMLLYTKLFISMHFGVFVQIGGNPHPLIRCVTRM